VRTVAAWFLSRVVLMAISSVIPTGEEATAPPGLLRVHRARQFLAERGHLRR